VVGHRREHAGVHEAVLLQVHRPQREDGDALAGADGLELEAQFRDEGRGAEGLLQLLQRW